MDRRLKALTAFVSAILFCGTFAACNKNADNVTVAKASSETTAATMGVDVWHEDMEEATTTYAVETVATKPTTTTEETTTTTTTTTKQTTTTTTTTTTPTTTTTAAPQTVAAPVAATAAPPQTAPPATATAAPIVTAAPETTTTTQETHPPVIIYLPVSGDEDEYVARVRDDDDEWYDVCPDGYYKPVNMTTEHARNADPDDYSFWLTDNKRVLNYNLPIGYIIVPEESVVRFYDTRGEVVTEIPYKDFVLLCNCTLKGYGNAGYVPTYERGLITEVIINVYNRDDCATLFDAAKSMPNFKGCDDAFEEYVMLPDVNDNVKDAVAMVFCNPDYFNEGYTEFASDGVWNYFW